MAIRGITETGANRVINLGNIPPYRRTAARIGLCFDDARMDELAAGYDALRPHGFTAGIGYITGQTAKWDDDAQYDPTLEELWESGWEIIAHSTDGDELPTLTLSEAETNMSTSQSDIETLTGQDCNSFVFPGHATTDELDQIAQKYFDKLRSSASVHIYGAGETHPRDTRESYYIENETLGDLKRVTDAVIASGGYAYFYTHDWSATLTSWVDYCAARGIEIVPPCNVLPTRVLHDTPYEGTGYFFDSNSGVTSVDSAESYVGSDSVKFTAPGSGFDNGDIDSHEEFLNPESALYRISWRYKATSQIEVSSDDWGWLCKLACFDESGGRGAHSIVEGGQDGYVTGWPASGTTIPAATWDRVDRLFYLPGHIKRFGLLWEIANIADTSGDFWIDDMRVERIRPASSFRVSTTLNGTSGREVSLGFPLTDADGHQVVSAQIIPTASHAGQLYLTYSTSHIDIFSTDAGDAGAVDLVVHMP